MKKLKAFAYVFYKSLTSLEYYKDILETDFSFSIKYLAVLALVATIVNTSITSTVEIPQIMSWVYEQKNNLIDVYPNDLEITAQDNALSINQPEPYEIKTPGNMKENGAPLPANLVVFDKNGTINDFEVKDTLVLVNETNMLVRNGNSFDTYPIKDIPNGKVDKQIFTNAVNSFDSVIKYIPFAFVLVTALVLFFYYFVFRLVYLLIVSLTLLIVNMFVKPDVEFKHLYRIALHAMTAPLLIDLVLRVFNIQYFVTIPWFYFLNVVLGTIVIIKAAKIND